MSAHTPEPWDGREVHRRDAQGTPFVLLSMSDYERAKQCVNALATLTDEALSGGWTYAGQNAYALKLEREIGALRAQHNELRGALLDLLTVTTGELPLVQFGGDPTPFARSSNRARSLLARLAS